VIVQRPSIRRRKAATRGERIEAAATRGERIEAVNIQVGGTIHTLKSKSATDILCSAMPKPPTHLGEDPISQEGSFSRMGEGRDEGGSDGSNGFARRGDLDRALQ